MLEPILKGLVEWIYALMVEIMSYASGELLGVLSMNLDYFEDTAPVISEIVNVFVALGWALLIGNMVFQLMKSMASGLGFEAEDPKIIFLRTFVFSFLLVASRQICDIGLSITGKVIDMLEMPDSIEVVTPDESMFSLGGEAKWLLVIIVGVVLMVQMVKLLFEIGERYVITSVLTFFSPLAFAMGGSRNTNDIFKGWCRMYGSMMILMIMNIVFLKLIMSAMSQISSGGVLIWLVFVVALTRVARKIDSHIGKLGLNPAQTGEGLGSRIPGMMTVMAARALGSTVSRSIRGASSAASSSGASGGQKGRGGSTHARRQPNPYAGGRPTSEKRSAFGGLGGASYYMGEGSSSGSGAASINGGDAKAGGSIKHGGTNMSNTSVDVGDTNSQNRQSGSDISTQISGNTSAASPGHQTQVKGGHPPLQRQTSTGSAPRGNPISGGAGGEIQFTDGGAKVRNTSAVSNTSMSDIQGSEAAAIHDGSTAGHGGAIPLPRGDAHITPQTSQGQSGGTDIHAASSQQSNLESRAASTSMSRIGRSPETEAGSVHGGDGTVIQGPGVNGSTVPLPRTGTVSGSQSSGGGTTVQGKQAAVSQHSGVEAHESASSTPKTGDTSIGQPLSGSIQKTSAAELRHSGIEGHGSTVPIPKVGAAAGTQGSSPMTASEQTPSGQTMAAQTVSGQAASAKTLSAQTEPLHSSSAQHETAHSGVTDIPHDSRGAVQLPRSGSSQGSVTAGGSVKDAAHTSTQVQKATADSLQKQGSQTAMLRADNTSHPSQEQTATKTEIGGVVHKPIQSGQSGLKPDNKLASRPDSAGNTANVQATKGAGSASLPKTGGEQIAAQQTSAQSGLSVRTAESSSVHVSNVQKGSSAETSGAKSATPAGGEKVPHISGDNRPSENKGVTSQSKIQTIHENAGKNGSGLSSQNTGSSAADNHKEAPILGAAGQSSQGQPGTRGGSGGQARDKLSPNTGAISQVNSSPLAAGKESTVISKGNNAPETAGNTVINKGYQPSDTGHGDKGQASKVTGFERGGDTNIESRNYTAPERTVEKEVKPEYGKDEHLADKKADRPGKTPGVHANTTFSRNRGPAENGERINHDYTHGKYDPAANNHKTDNQFFVKETLKGSRIKRERMKSKRVLKRGGKNGSGKQ